MSHCNIKISNDNEMYTMTLSKVCLGHFLQSDLIQPCNILDAVRCMTGVTPQHLATFWPTTCHILSLTNGVATAGHQFAVSDLCFQKSLTQALLFAAGAREGAKKCSYELCECDRTFVKCLSQFACPKSKAMCTSPWRYFQNLFMGLGTGMVS